MKGPAPKSPELRQRVNKAPTAATLTTNETVRRPPLPRDMEWHPMTRRWWLHIWRSPMASQFLESDIDGLIMLAYLHNSFWDNPGVRFAAEIRQQESRFGLTPLDRWRLQWKIEEQTESAGPIAQEMPEQDPRTALRLIQ